MILVFENSKVIDRKVVFTNDTQKIAVDIVALANKYDVTGVSIDSVGIGKGVADVAESLLRERPIKILKISSGSAASDPDRFVNLRAEMWWYVWEQIKNQKIYYPESIEIRRQLSSVRYTLVNSTGKIGLEPKKKTKILLGRSPDDADAFVYGIWGLRHFEPRKQKIYEFNRNPQKSRRPGYGWEAGVSYGI